MQGRCEPCVPTVISAFGPPPSVPAGNSGQCYAGPNDFASAPCPVVQCGGLRYWAFSYSDNRFSSLLAGFDANGTLVKSEEVQGARYLWNMTADASAQTVTLFGQGTQEATVPFSFFQSP